ncbi:MAG: sugar ABC transporter permease [Caldilineaceae bacterium]|nr:sugar ABC transporter permease [Caldilineaceae bacterium]
MAESTDRRPISALDDISPPEEASITKRWWSSVRSIRGGRKGDLTMGYLFILPALALFVVFQAYPLVRGFTIAFSDYRFLLPDHQPFNGLDNFVEMYNDPLFWESFRRSIVYTLIYTPVNICLGLAIAVLISRIHRPTEAAVYRVISYLPVVLPIAVALLLWKQLLHPEFGYLNYFLREIIGIPDPPAWLADPTWVVPTMAMAAVWKNVGQNVLLFLIGLYNINGELYEAASIDGAGGWNQFWYITLPLLRPTLVIVLVLAAGIIGTAEESLILFGRTSAGPQNAGMLVGRYSYDIAFLVGDMRWGYAAAMNLIMGIVSALMAVLVFRFFRSERVS